MGLCSLCLDAPLKYRAAEVWRIYSSFLGTDQVDCAINGLFGDKDDILPFLLVTPNFSAPVSQEKNYDKEKDKRGNVKRKTKGTEKENQEVKQ